jgi:hypothetical protein
MKPFLLVTIAVLFLFSMGLTRANLGETEAQCIARYGAESDVRTDMGYRQVGDKAASFTMKTSYGSVDIRVTFLNGMSCHETFCNSDSSRGLTEDQLKDILNSQSAGLKWDQGKTVYRTNGGITAKTVDWRRSDGAVAKFWMSGKAGSRTQTGQVDLSTKQYAYVQGVYDRENGGN